MRPSRSGGSVPFGSTSSAPVLPSPVLTASPLFALDWTFTGTDPDFWIVLPNGDTDPGDLTDAYGGSERTGTTTANEGQQYWMVGVASDMTTIVTGFSNAVTILG